MNAILFRCAFCDQLFYTLDGLIPVDGTSYYGRRRLYFANNRKLIHDLYEVTAEEINKPVGAKDFLGQLMESEPPDTDGMEVLQ